MLQLPCEDGIGQESIHINTTLFCHKIYQFTEEASFIHY